MALNSFHFVLQLFLSKLELCISKFSVNTYKRYEGYSLDYDNAVKKYYLDYCLRINIMYLLCAKI